MQKYNHYINGNWVSPSGGEWFDTDNPYTGKTWAQIAKGNAKDVDAAVADAKAAFEANGAH